MTSDWRLLARAMQVSGNAIRVPLDRNRQHLVWVLEHRDGWELSGESANAEALEQAGLTHAELWRRNRYQDLIGYVIDEEGTAWVTAWMPTAGTTAEEFALVVREVAVEADRLEFYCTGDDQL